MKARDKDIHTCNVPPWRLHHHTPMDGRETAREKGKDFVRVEAKIVFVKVLHGDVAVFFYKVGGQPAFGCNALDGWWCGKGERVVAQGRDDGDTECLDANGEKQVDGKQHMKTLKKCEGQEWRGPRAKRHWKF